MFDSILRVKYMNLKTGFLYLSPKHSHLNTGACLRLTYNDNEVAYFSASITRNIVDLDNIGINSLYAKALGMKENNFVNVSEIEQLPVVNSISIQPYNKTDFEVLELLAHNVQSHLLDQIRIINAGQKIVIWIGNISVVVLVDNVQPIYPGALDFLTEVVIKPPDSNMNRSEHKNSSEYMEGFIAFLNANITNTHTSLVEVKNLKPDFELFYRIIPLSELPINIKYLQPFKMFTWKEGLYGEFFTDNSENLFFTMTLLQNSYSAKELYVEVCFLDDLLDVSSVYLNNLSGNIYVDNSVLNYFQCESGVRVSLKTIKNQLARPSEIEVQHGLEKNSKDVLEHLKLLLSQSNDKPQVLNANFPIRIEDNFYYSLKFPPNLNSYYIINGNTLRDCSFSFHTESVRPLEEIRNEKSKEMFCMSLSIVQRISDNILSVVWRKGYFQSENVILTGKTGMGKSKLLNHIVSILQKYPYFVYTETVECKTIKGKTIDSLHKIFMDLFSKLVLCQPSVLVLDDLNILCESCDGEETPNNVYFNRVSEMLCNLLSSYPESNKIAIIASTDSVSKLNKHIYRSRGNHLFKNIFALNDLNKTDRVHLLEYFFQQANSKNLDYKELAVKTDGFVIQDIKDFYEKALFEAYKGPHLNEYPVVNQDNCELALKKTCSLSLQNVKFHSPGNKSFDNIGGLSEVKKILTESFLWPVKYSNIFSKAPLRLQSGLLLYGLPGTGKTLLAGAAAKQCSLRLISVKGPELLSKYIGASEQAVRDVFEKAQRAKPCILFFDEFDSLAPRRGHDNTGVTDRVVNQLLTQLDGVESLTGVCVLAATSRPDLLDPALLRPGRLDKQILCPMPDEKGRLEILKILSTTLDFENEVDLEEIADKTEGFSGADLQSLLYSVQISSMKTMEDIRFENVKRRPPETLMFKSIFITEKESLSSWWGGVSNLLSVLWRSHSLVMLVVCLYSYTAVYTGPELSIVKNKITQSVLLDSLSKTRPSLTKREKDKYERIYAKFQGGNLEDFKTGSKVTLA